jgi:hypothetical protein
MDEPTPSPLERAYRAIILWDEERMQPRLDERIAWFRARVEELPPRPIEAFRAAARAETLSVALWFQENEKAFLREAVSYLGDDVLAGLKETGVDGQFMQVILGALEDARGALRDRMQEIRDASDAAAVGGRPASGSEG